VAFLFSTPGVLDRLSSGGHIAISNSPEPFAAFIKAEQAKGLKVVQADIKIN
jgi:hypothetical protein